MKLILILCICLLTVTACSQVLGTSSTIPPSPTQVVNPAVSPSPDLPLPTGASASASTATPVSSLRPTNGCIPAMTPAGFFPSGEKLLGFRDDFLYIYNLKTHTLELKFQVPTRVVKATLSPGGDTIAVGLENFLILLIRASDQKVLNTLDAHKGIISGLVFSPGSDRLLSASEDSWVRIWTLDKKQLDAFQPTGADNVPAQIMGIGVSSDWRELATIPFDGKMNLWSLSDHSLLGTFEGSIYGGYSGSQAAFSPDGKYLAQHLGAGGGYLTLWRIEGGELLLRGENITTGIDFSPDGKFFAYGEMLPEGGGHIIIRSPDGSEQLFELKTASVSMPAVPIFSPDSSILVAVDYMSNNLLAWTTTDGQQLTLGQVTCPDK